MIPDELRRFVAALYPTDTGYVELRLLPVKQQIFIPMSETDLLSAVLENHVDDGENVYIGVATRRTETGGALENCSELWTLFVDVDFASIAEPDARLRLDSFPIPPHVIVQSGNGLHPYW